MMLLLNNLISFILRTITDRELVNKKHQSKWTNSEPKQNPSLSFFGKVEFNHTSAFWLSHRPN